MELKTVNQVSLPGFSGTRRLTEEQVSHDIDMFISNVKKTTVNTPAHNNLLGFFELVKTVTRCCTGH